MNRRAAFGFLIWLGLVTMIASFSVAAADAQSLFGAALTNALRQGGYVLVMRHANSPAQPPAREAADPENVKLERQLDSAGRDTARAMGEAVKASRIPVGEVLSSPTYRALQTVQLASLGNAKIFAELDEGAAGMQSNADAARVAWLKGRIAEAPRAGTNTILVTHAPNIKGAFGVDAAAGETLVFCPDGKGGASQMARIKIEDWPALAK
jgi:phosphohistidine phosphatase SixA